MGRGAIFFELLSLVVALTLTVWTDIDGARKEREATEKQNAADARRIAAEARQQAFETKVLGFVEENEGSFTPSTKRSAGALIETLPDADRHKLRFPDLFSYIGDQLDRQVQARLSKTPDCLDTQLHTWKDSGFPSAGFVVSREPFVIISLQLRPDDVQLTVNAATGVPNLGKGYAIAFSDGSETQQMKCEHLKTTTSCFDSISTSENPKSAYALLRTKVASKVRADNTLVSIDPSKAAELRKPFPVSRSKQRSAAMEQPAA